MTGSELRAQYAEARQQLVMPLPTEADQLTREEELAMRGMMVIPTERRDDETEVAAPSAQVLDQGKPAASKPPPANAPAAAIDPWDKVAKKSHPKKR